MSTLSQIELDYEKAFKARKHGEVSTLRLLLAALKNEKISKRDSFGEDDIIAVIKREIKKRKEAIVDYERANRMELVNKEKEEIIVLEKYLPEQMSEDEVKRKVLDVMSQLPGEDNVGKIMGKVMAELQGLADGNLVRKIVEEELGK